MKISHLGIYLLFIFLQVSACKKVNTTIPDVVPDSTKPVISLIDPTNNKVILLGTSLALELDLSDNKELKSYKVEIHKSLKNVDTSDWTYVNTWTIAPGKTIFKVKHSEILIPFTFTSKNVTTGNYEMVVTCTDTSGNEATTNIIIVLN
mgnify:CR=1 FL=1